MYLCRIWEKVTFVNENACLVKHTPACPVATLITIQELGTEAVRAPGDHRSTTSGHIWYIDR